MTPPAESDYWSRTFYDPLLIKANGPALLTTISAKKEATISVDLSLTPRSQFDQGGILVLIDDSCWVKAGIEYCDGVPRLSCVVTNDGFSDWSTQPWGWDGGPNATVKTTSLRMRVHKVFPGPGQGPAMVFEVFRNGTWQFVRIASLDKNVAHAAAGRGAEFYRDWRVGLFGFCPVAQNGCVAVFKKLCVGPRLPMSHEVDPEAEKKNEALLKKPAEAKDSSEEKAEADKRAGNAEEAVESVEDEVFLICQKPLFLRGLFGAQ
jgi:regulation of enolase protein 1 (concanavalin A-like superfamily)